MSNQVFVVCQAKRKIAALLGYNLLMIFLILFFVFFNHHLLEMYTQTWMFAVHYATIGIALFSALMLTNKLAALIQMLRQPEIQLVTITSEGLEFPRLGMLSWDQIHAICSGSSFLSPWASNINIYLNDMPTFLLSQKPLRKWLWQLECKLGNPHIIISGALSSVSGRQIETAIRKLAGPDEAARIFQPMNRPRPLTATDDLPHTIEFAVSNSSIEQPVISGDKSL